MGIVESVLVSFGLPASCFENHIVQGGTERISLNLKHRVQHPGPEGIGRTRRDQQDSAVELVVLNLLLVSSSLSRSLPSCSTPSARDHSRTSIQICTSAFASEVLAPRWRTLPERRDPASPPIKTSSYVPEVAVKKVFIS